MRLEICLLSRSYDSNTPNAKAKNENVRCAPTGLAQIRRNGSSCNHCPNPAQGYSPASISSQKCSRLTISNKVICPFGLAPRYGKFWHRAKSCISSPDSGSIRSDRIDSILSKQDSGGSLISEGISLKVLLSLLELVAVAGITYRAGRWRREQDDIAFSQIHPRRRCWLGRDGLAVDRCPPEPARVSTRR